MNQTSLFAPPTDDALEAAKRLIRAYVKRGDSDDYLKDMGASSPQSYWVMIGGYLDGKRYGNDKILVSRDMQGRVVNRVFNKKEVIQKVRDEL